MNTKQVKIAVPIAACIAVIVGLTVLTLSGYFSNGNINVGDDGCNSTDISSEANNNTYVVGEFNTDKYIPLIINANHGPDCHSDTFSNPTKFWYELTEEQLAAVFPALKDKIAFESVTAEYNEAGKLRKVVAIIEQHDLMTFQTKITASRDTGYCMGYSGYYYFDEHDSTKLNDFEKSNIHGFSVIALCRDFSWLETNVFHATFSLNGVLYRISVSDHSDTNERNEYLEMLVNEIIIGKVFGGLKADLRVLDNPVIPELRDEELTLEQAFADPDFGAYIPKNGAGETNFGGLDFKNALRFLNQQSNMLRVEWTPNESYSPFVQWQIEEVKDYHYKNLVALDEPEKYDMSFYPDHVWSNVPRELWEVFQTPVFRAEDMSFDVVMKRSYEFTPHFVAGGFCVLIDDEIAIFVHSSNVPAEIMWEMIKSVIG